MEQLRILFVDDETELVATVVERLQLRSFAARGATSGAEALAEMNTHTYDVVILDVIMPGIGGLKVLDEIQRMRSRPAVVLLSGHGSSETVEEGLRLGAFAYLQKPVDIDKLLAVVRQAADRSRDTTAPA